METRPKKRVREKSPQWPQKRQAEAAVKEKEAGNEKEREKREARGTTWGDPGGGCDKRTKIESVVSAKYRAESAFKSYSRKCDAL